MGKGKQKIEIKKITKDSSRMVAFSKRRKGLFKKAAELESRTGAKVAILVFSATGKPYTCGDVETISSSLGLIPAQSNGEIWEERHCSTSESNGEIWEKRHCSTSESNDDIWDSFNLETYCSSPGPNSMWDSFNLETHCSSSGQNGIWDSFNLETHSSSSESNGIWDSFNLETHCSSSGIPFNESSNSIRDSFNVETHCSSSGIPLNESWNVETCHDVNELLVLKAHLERTREKLLESQFLESLWS